MSILKKILIFSSTISLVLSQEAIASKRLSGSGAKALNGITLDENLAGKNPNPLAKGAYPIAALT